LHALAQFAHSLGIHPASTATSLAATAPAARSTAKSATTAEASPSTAATATGTTGPATTTARALRRLSLPLRVGAGCKRVRATLPIARTAEWPIAHRAGEEASRSILSIGTLQALAHTARDQKGFARAFFRRDA
jgi:hypothetical protein